MASPHFCTSCGTSLPDAARFCGECGHQTQRLTAVPATIASTAGVAAEQSPIADVGASSGRRSFAAPAIAAPANASDDPRDFDFCGWKELLNDGWTFEEPASAFLHVCSRDMPCRIARRDYRKLSRRPGVGRMIHLYVTDTARFVQRDRDSVDKEDSLPFSGVRTEAGVASESPRMPSSTLARATA